MIKKSVLFIVLLLMVLLLACSNESITEMENNTSAQNHSEDISTATEKEELLIVTDHYPPLVYSPSNPKGEGFTLELTRKAFERQGIEVRYAFYPWPRCVELINDHTAFATVPWASTSERLETHAFSKFFAKNELKLAYMEGNQRVPDEYTSFDDLKELTFGAVDAYFYVPQLQALDIQLDISQNEKDALTKLYNGRYDILPIEYNVYQHLIAETFGEEGSKIKVLDPPVREYYYGLRVSQSYPGQKVLLEKFNRGLKQLVDDGTYDSLLEKYDLDPEWSQMFKRQFDDPPLQVAYTSFPPMEYTDEQGNPAGIHIELMQDILASLGFSVDDYVITEYPWARLQEIGRKGAADIVIDAYYDERRTLDYIYSESPLVEFTNHFIVKSDSGITFNGLEFSKPVRSIGVVRSYVYGEKAEQIMRNSGARIIITDSSEDLIEGLLRDQYEVAIEANRVAQYICQEIEEEKCIRILEPGVNGISGYLIYPKSNYDPELAADIERVFNQLIIDGTYQRIHKKYIHE